MSLKVNYEGNLPEGLTLEGVTLSKDTISITGDINRLEEVDSISTETINLSTINESKDVSLGIILPEGIYLSNKNEKITASIKVKNVETKVENKITSKKIEGIVVALNNKQNEKLNYEAESIFVELEGAKEELDLVTSANIVATASVQDITEAGEYEVLVDVKLENTGSTIKIKSKTEKIKITVK